jgi:ABC-type bacteriocin/lantibiotic exporter with double-glycine peptidase domain
MSDIDTVEDALEEVDRLIASLSKLREYLAQLKLTSSKNQQAGRQLNVPWIGQNVPDVSTDDYSGSDCGPACVAMWLGFSGKQVTVDQVSEAAGLPAGYRYTLGAHLIVAAKVLGLRLARVTNITTNLIKGLIDAGTPLIVLVHYGSLPRRFDPKFTKGHWIIITGYTDQRVIYNDPYWPDEAGRAIDMSWTELEKALSDCALDGNTPRQGLAAAG